MSASQAVLLTLAENSEQFVLQENQIVYVTDDTLGASVIYAEDDYYRKEKVVTETPAQVATGTEMLINPTLPDGGVLWINADRISVITEDTLGSDITYDDGGAGLKHITSTDTPATLRTAINNLTD